MTPLLAVLADNHRKSELLHLLRSWRGELEGVTVLATRDTGNLVRSRLGLDVALVEAGSRGGALQIAALVIEGAVSAVVALHRPSMTPEEDAGTIALRQVCDIHDVAFASSLATADAIVAALVRQNSCRQGLSALDGFVAAGNALMSTSIRSVSREE